MENARHDHREEGAHDGIDHQVAERLTQNDAPHPTVTLVDRHEVTVAVALTGRACCQSNAQHQRLLQDKHQHGREDGRAVAALRIEDRHILEVEGTGGDLVLACSIVARDLGLYLGTHRLSHSNGGLVDGLIGEHQCHVAIDTDGGLFHTVQTGGKVLGDEVDALHHLPAHERLGIVEVIGIIGHPHIGRGIAHPDELARLLRVRQVDHRHWYLMHYLVVVDPRIEQRIDQRYDDAEDEHALVAEDLLDLLPPHVGSILQPVIYIMEYRHR